MIYVTLQIVNFLEAYQKNYNCDCGSTNKDNVCVGGISIQACVKSLLSLVDPDITVMTARYVMMIVISFTTAMIAVNDVTVNDDCYIFYDCCDCYYDCYNFYDCWDCYYDCYIFYDCCDCNNNFCNDALLPACTCINFKLILYLDMLCALFSGF